MLCFIVLCYIVLSLRPFLGSESVQTQENKKMYANMYANMFANMYANMYHANMYATLEVK